MGTSNLVFEVRYGGRFDRQFGWVYVGGEVVVHHESYDPDKLSYFELEDMLKEYGYGSGDLMYFKHPEKEREGGEGDDDGDDDDEGECRVDLNDPCWADKLNDNEDLFDVDVDDGDHGVGPSKGTINRDKIHFKDGNGAGASGDGEDEVEVEVEDEDEDEEEHIDGSHKVHSVGKMICFEDDEEDNDTNSDMGRSDILVSPIPSDEEDEATSLPTNCDFHVVDLNDPTLKLKMRFPNIQQFREAVKEYNVKRGKDICFKKNERMKCIAVCRDDKCRYRVYARQMEDEVSFQIRSMQPKHVCGRKYKSSIVNSTWIANQLIEKFKVQPNMPLEVIQHEVKEKWRVDVTPSIMYRARRKAGKQIYGKLEGQYGRLWDYCETLRKTNKGTCIMMKVERPNPNLPPRFQRLYLSLATMKKGFIEGYKLIIGVDGCFLKGAFKGQLLAAVSRDGNNNMYPIAFAIVEAETKDSWIWFLETLVSDLGTHDQHVRPTFISDRHKGLIPALNEVLPMADHRFCVRHLYANFKNVGHKGVALKEMLWGAASAYTEGEFTAYMEGLRGMNKDAYEYLNRVDPSCWSRAWFSEYYKCDLLVNNICECFNSYILKARDKPILTMLEMIRKKLMRRYQAKREGIEKLTGKLCPRIVTKLEEIGIAASDCVAVYAGENMFEVTCPTGKQFVVDLRRKLCGCR
ncbi:uncharacterized protein LOC132181751 [Corylus avellana]|uniref:uncharacterized protein LOC132181751 n=1 Tax=Corylus avellana TaxID=13451 RepID=UPI00286A0D38|nr:uncharacterized protein LOC132181751 [Corylus avellana]